MRKIWIMSGVAVAAMAATLAAMPQPARSSQDWLAKAQSEFASKARDAVIQRRIVQSAPGTVQAMANSAEIVPPPAQSSEELTVSPERMSPVVTDVATMPEPVARPVDDQASTVSSRGFVPAPPPSVVVAAATTADIVAPPPVAATVAPPAVATVAPAATPVAPAVAPAPAPAAVKQAAPAKAVTAPASDTAPRKARQASKQTAPARAARRPESTLPVEARGLEALRARAPEIAAMIGRYM